MKSEEIRTISKLCSLFIKIKDKTKFYNYILLSITNKLLMMGGETT
jgi:hypothetical protein